MFTKTVELIKKLYGVEISRQAVRQRAMNHPEALQQIREDSVLEAEDTHRDLMLNSTSDRVRRGCSEFVMSTLGKNKGYTHKTEIDANVVNQSSIEVYLPDNGREPKPEETAEPSESNDNS